MRFQLTVIAEGSKAEGMYKHLKNDYLPQVGERFQLRSEHDRIFGKVHEVLHILDTNCVEDADGDTQLQAVIVYVSVSMADYRRLEETLPSSWSNFDHI